MALPDRSMNRSRAPLIASGVAIGIAATIVVVYVLRFLSAAGTDVADAFGRFDVSDWGAVDAAILVAIASTVAAGVVAVDARGRGLRSARAFALMLESFAAALAVAMPLLAGLLVFSFMLGPGPCGPTFYDAHAPACAARDAGLLATFLAAILGLPLIGVVVRAVQALKPWSMASTVASAVILLVGGIAGGATGVALTGLVSTEPIERILNSANFLRGRVMDARTGAPVKSRVDIFRSDRPCCSRVDYTSTRDEHYEIELPPGGYRVLFVPLDANASVSGEWWGGNSFEAASVITMPGHGSSVDARLRQRARVAGRVTTTTTHQPIRDMTVYARFSLAGATVQTYVAQATTDADGRYTLQLPAGTYVLEFSKIGYLGSVWRDARLTMPATTITVTDRDLSDIDQLVPGS